MRVFSLSSAILLSTVVAAMADVPRAVEALAECPAAAPEGVTLGAGADCGYVTVPQNRAGGTEDTIKVAYMRLRAVQATDAPPLFILAGGPGQSVISADRQTLFQEPLLGPILKDHDVVLLEQRGTFYSRPALTCPETAATLLAALKDNLTPADASAKANATLNACVARLQGEGVDFASYNTVENASDINDVRSALGYDQIIFYGESYATLLGQFLLRQHPDALAGIILDGTESPTTQSWAAGRAINAQWGLDNVTQLCAQDPNCAAIFDIPALGEELFATFGKDPVPVSVPAPDQGNSGDTYAVSVAPEDLASFVYSLQTSKFGVVVMPMELTQLIASGRDAIAETLAQPAVASILAAPPEDENSMLTLMHAAMVCSDDPAQEGEAVNTEGAGTYARLFAAKVERQYVDLCNVIAVPQLPESSDALVQSDVPTLILSGGLDVQTPFFLGNEVAEKLTNVTHVIFPAGFHVQIANLNRCAISIMNDFVRDPGAKLATGCADDEKPLPFVLPDDVEGTAP